MNIQFKFSLYDYNGIVSIRNRGVTMKNTLWKISLIVLMLGMMLPAAVMAGDDDHRRYRYDDDHNGRHYKKHQKEHREYREHGHYRHEPREERVIVRRSRHVERHYYEQPRVIVTGHYHGRRYCEVEHVVEHHHESHHDHSYFPMGAILMGLGIGLSLDHD